MTSYAEFLTEKAQAITPIGAPIQPGDVHALLHPWQRELVAWAVRTGRAALWADTGLGKTLMQLEWARLSGDRVLVLAPLAVCQQTVREGQKIDVDVHYAREDDGRPGITITNYEISERFDASRFDAVVLDESSILKDVTSKTRDRLIEQFAKTPRRLACTATPAPNDAAELANHAEFLGIATRREMLSTYFVHDQDGWRPKGHARGPMYAWMAQWAAAVRRPSDNAAPVKAQVSNEEWIAWARPVWLDIRETNTLNVRVAKDDADERHICPLQLDFIDRCVRLWSNPGETVLSPFAGIGSEVYMARKLDRVGIGCELKPSYWRTAVANLQALEAEGDQHSFIADLLGESGAS